MCDLNLVELKRKHCEWVMRRHGLQSNLVELDNGAIIRCWAPVGDPHNEKSKRPIVVLLHGFGVEGQLAWEAQVKALSKKFRLYIPDLLFFGHSRPPIRGKHDDVDDRSEFFQASCVYETLMKLMRQGKNNPCQSISIHKDHKLQPVSTSLDCSILVNEKCSHGTTSMDEKYPNGLIESNGEGQPPLIPLNGVASIASISSNGEVPSQSMSSYMPIHVVGHSYGGFVAYRMAHMYPTFVSSLIIVASGITVTSRDIKDVIATTSCESIHQLLLPRSVARLKISISTVFSENRWLWSHMPNIFYRYIYRTMFRDVAEKMELLDAIIIGKENAPPIPTVEQDVFIIWGDKDEIFDISLGHQLKEFLGDKAKLAIMKDVGHVPQTVKPREFNNLLFSYLETFSTKYGSTNP